jgi:hypothetical protein
MVTCTQSKLIFKHMVELPHCGCVFCSTEEEVTRRTRIFLIFKDKDKIYQRNGVKGNWEEVVGSDEHQNVWNGFEQAITERKIPSFVADMPEALL